ncbi:nucleoporin complex subunit 54-domain-containing protein [Pilobolus umbonatus]|nr:nucleoporin complex subunit 54-domain-containing protein [Pilobolus umbonatus]
MFGSTQTNNTFGTSPGTTQNSAGTLFGASNTTPLKGTFVNTPNTSAGTLFGANTAFGQQATPAFGANTSAPSTAFGASATTGNGVAGFGTSSAPTTGGFGNNTAPTTGFNTGFGATSAPATGFNTGFGATSAPASGFNTGFGATSAPASGFNTGFGATSAPASGFSAGFGTSSAPATGGFGNTGNTTGGFGFTGGFGTTNNGNTSFMNNQSTAGFGMQQQQMVAAPPQEKVWQELALLRAHFDPSSPLCQFRHYFYNKVPPNEIHLYVRPPNQDEQLWNEAMRKNPDPTCMVPVLAVGFDDILKRMEIQNKQVELHQQKLKEIEDRLTAVQRQYSLGTKVKSEEHMRRHLDLNQRLLRLLRYTQVLRYKGFPLSNDEERAMNKLNQLSGNNQNVDTPEQMLNKMLKLWNQLQAIKAQNVNQQNGKVEIWRTSSDEDTKLVAKILEDEQKGIVHISDVLKADMKDLEAVETMLQNNLTSKS